MNTNFSVYSTDPFPNFTRTSFEKTNEIAETITARRIRRRLYQNDAEKKSVQKAQQKLKNKEMQRKWHWKF